MKKMKIIKFDREQYKGASEELEVLKNLVCAYEKIIHLQRELLGLDSGPKNGGLKISWIKK